MNVKRLSSFRTHLALRFLVISSLVATVSAFSLYRWQSARDLASSIETIRHFSTFIGNDSIAMHLEGENIVFVEGALRKLSAVRPILYSYVLDHAGRIVATSAGSKAYGPCCFAWEPPLGSRPDGSFTLDFAANSEGALSDELRINRGDRIVLVGIPIHENSTGQRRGTLTVAVSGAEALRAARADATRLALLLFGLEFLIGLPATLLLSRQHNSLQKAHAAASLGELASQIAHDIRSPLASLNAALEGPHFTEESRRLARGAITSIRGIVQGLLDRNRALAAPVESSRPEPLKAESLPLLLDKTIEQKLVQYRDRADLEIKLELVPEAYSLFALVPSIELERIISNLVNNAAEAIAGPGRITVALSSTEGFALIEVRDTGRGIPAELLSRLGQRGATWGKADGSGLGLYHAQTTISSWGGSIRFSSKPGQGSCVTLEIPKTDAPGWFAREVKVPRGGHVVVVDDDETVHMLWGRRLDTAAIPRERRVHARTPDEAVAWFRANLGAEALYLCDYELGGHATSGLDLIERLGVSATAILVTHHADEQKIRQRCEKFGIPILPKSLLPIVPVS